MIIHHVMTFRKWSYMRARDPHNKRSHPANYQIALRTIRHYNLLEPCMRIAIRMEGLLKQAMNHMGHFIKTR